MNILHFELFASHWYTLQKYKRALQGNNIVFKYSHRDLIWQVYNQIYNLAQFEKAGWNTISEMRQSHYKRSANNTHKSTKLCNCNKAVLMNIQESKKKSCFKLYKPH